MSETETTATQEGENFTKPNSEVSEKIMRVLKECSHIGFHTSPAQNVLAFGPVTFIVISHICSNCGASLVDIRPMAAPEENAEPASQIIKN